MKVKYGAKTKKLYRTIGVRFLTANVARVYTYKIAKRHKVHLGQKFAVDNDHGCSVVVVVRIDRGVADCGYALKTITEYVATLGD